MISARTLFRVFIALQCVAVIVAIVRGSLVTQQIILLAALVIIYVGIQQTSLRHRTRERFPPFLVLIPWLAVATVAAFSGYWVIAAIGQIPKNEAAISFMIAFFGFMGTAWAFFEARKGMRSYRAQNERAASLDSENP